jgi:hypothetical protein
MPPHTTKPNGVAIKVRAVAASNGAPLAADAVVAPIAAAKNMDII